MTNKKPGNGPLPTAAVPQSDGTMRNCTNSLYHAPADGASLLDAILDALADRLAPRLQAPPKLLWTADDLAQLYGVSKSSIRAKMAAGEFGELVYVDSRQRVATLEGVKLFNETHQKTPDGRIRTVRRPKNHLDPGPI